MKTERQLFQRFEQINQTGDSSDPLWTMRSMLFRFLPYALAKSVLRPDVDQVDWHTSGVPLPLTPDYVDSYIKRIVKRGFDIAVKHRSIEAKRNILRIIPLLWIKDDPLQGFADARRNFTNFGMPILRKVGEKYHEELWNVRSLKLMSDGEKCDPACPTCGNMDYQ